MHKLVNVLRVTELRPDDAVERELALVTVSSLTTARADLLAAARVSGAAVVDFADDSITFQIVARPDDVGRARKTRPGCGASRTGPPRDASIYRRVRTAVRLGDGRRCAVPDPLVAIE